MRYKLLGKSGLRVSELCLGTMTFGEEWGWGASKAESQRIFDAFAEAGGNFIDTANRYTEGTSEKYVGEFIASSREYFVVATKYTLFTRQGDPNASGNHRKNMVQALDASLKRLSTDYVDLYWVHAWDFMTPVEEVMRALDDLVRAGKVLYVGVSDTPAWIVSRANTLAELRGWSPFIASQVEYSLAERTPERELLPMARALDIGTLAWSPLARGLLSGKYTRQDGQTSSGGKGRLAQWGTEFSERERRIAKAVQQVANEIGHSPAQVALNWLRAQDVIPVLGVRNLSQLEDNLGCLDFRLPPEQVQRLGEVSEIALGFPHDFLASEGIRNIVYSGMYDQIYNHRSALTNPTG